MEIIKNIEQLKSIRKSWGNDSVALVPTMGALHKGHLSLIKKAKSLAKRVVVSVFVNPTQFGQNEDFSTYPRDLNADSKLCEEEGVDIVFAPSEDQMYKDGYDKNKLTLVCPSYYDVDKLCGKSRSGHFDGVASVVSKLFNIVKPDFACFGQKDAQQLFIIQKMVKDLNFDIEIVACQIIREEDGLALSSRNTYLDSKARIDALKLSKALFKIKELYKSGQQDIGYLRDCGLSMLLGIEVEYLEFLSLDKFEENDIISKATIVLIAARVKSSNREVRLIDNIIIGE